MEFKALHGEVSMYNLVCSNSICIYLLWADNALLRTCLILLLQSRFGEFGMLLYCRRVDFCSKFWVLSVFKGSKVFNKHAQD